MTPGPYSNFFIHDPNKGLSELAARFCWPELSSTDGESHNGHVTAVLSYTLFRCMVERFTGCELSGPARACSDYRVELAGSDPVSYYAALRHGWA